MSEPILVEHLSVWDICFRWFGLDPRRLYFRIPLAAENIARTLLIAIHNAELLCESITLEKRHFDNNERKESFDYWVEDFFKAYNTHKSLNRKLLKWAVIERYDFMLWCERMNITLPEFWFPKGWSLQYRILENEIHPGHMYMVNDWSSEDRSAYFADLKNQQISKEISADEKSRPSQLTRMTAQRVAANLWKQHPQMMISEMINRSEIQDLCGAKSYTPEVIRRWLSDVAPTMIKERRGRPKKKISSNE